MPSYAKTIFVVGMLLPTSQKNFLQQNKSINKKLPAVPITFIFFLFFLFCTKNTTAQLSKDFAAILPKESKPSNIDKKILSVDEKTLIIDKFDFDIPKKFIPVYDSIANSLSLDYNAEKNVRKKIKIGETLTSFYNLTGQYIRSLYYTDEMLKLAGDNDSTHFVKLGHQRLKGSLLSKLRRQEDAADFINTALDEAKAKKDTFGMGMLYYALATTYSTINLSQTAIQYIDSSIYYYGLVTKKHPDFAKMYGESVAVKFGQTVNLFEQSNDTSYLQKMRNIISFAHSKNINRPFFVIYPIVEAYSRKKYDTTIQLCDTFLNKNSQTKLIINNYIALVVTKYKALSLYESGKKNDGAKLLDKSIQDIINNPAKDESTARLRLPFLYRTSQLLQNFYANNNNWLKAYYYLSVNQSARDTLDFIVSQGKTFEANQKYNFAKKEIKVQELEKDNAIEIKKKNYALFILITSLLSFIVIASLLYNSYRNIKYKKKIAEQLAQNKIDQIKIASELQIMELEEKNLLIKQEEQKKLGMELHDDLAGTVAAVKMKVETELSNSKDFMQAERLKNISKHIADIYERTRNKSHQLYHGIGIEPELPFSKRIKLITDNSFASNQYKIKIDVDDNFMKEVNLEIKIQMLYIIQEAVTNIIKHSLAANISILIYEDINLLILNITDDGKGFNKNVNKNGIGLNSIHQRSSSINGTTKIISGINGTEIIVTIPFANEESN